MSGCAEFDALVKALQSAGVAGRIQYKEKLVSKEVLQGGCWHGLALAPGCCRSSKSCM